MAETSVRQYGYRPFVQRAHGLRIGEFITLGGADGVAPWTKAIASGEQTLTLGVVVLGAFPRADAGISPDPDLFYAILFGPALFPAHPYGSTPGTPIWLSQDVAGQGVIVAPDSGLVQMAARVIDADNIFVLGASPAQVL